jgi:hypothetical protein
VKEASIHIMPWIIYGGLAGFISIYAMGALMFAWTKYFTPEPVPASRGDGLVLLAFSLLGFPLARDWVTCWR